MGYKKGIFGFIIENLIDGLSNTASLGGTGHSFLGRVLYRGSVARFSFFYRKTTT
jgi:hypothetical protein